MVQGHALLGQLLLQGAGRRRLCSDARIGVSVKGQRTSQPMDGAVRQEAGGPRFLQQRTF